MIENYFEKTGGKKGEDENQSGPEKHPEKVARTEYCEGQVGDFSELNDEVTFKILACLPDLKWKEITAENLHLSYAVMFAPKDSRKIFNQLEKEILYERDTKVHVFGKWHSVPRKQASYGNTGLSYTFSGATVSAKPWTPLLRQLRDTLIAVTGYTFNFVLVNRYNNGSDYIGEHKDDERELVKKSPIASLSFGEERDFVFRHQDTRGSKATQKIEPVHLKLQSGSLLMMNFPTNSFWYHSLPVRKKSLGPRINLTFRHMHSGHS